MKKFIVYLLVIVIAVSLGFAVFFLVRDNEVISISSATIYKDVEQPFTIDVNHYNKKSYTKITVSVSDENIVSYDSNTSTFTAKAGGVARVNFRTTNAKFRNLWCDVVVGDGSEESPFYISTPEQLAAIGRGQADENGVFAGSSAYPLYTSDSCYKLVSDIDAKDINNGYWIPIRTFSGRFDGNGYTIFNMNIDRESYNAIASQDGNTYDPNLFPTENVGMFQKITSKGSVYNFKLSNVSASGNYTNFGTIAAINEGTIERIEIKDAKLSVVTEIFGGIVARNVTTESGANDTYTRNIARIDRCSINMILGKKTVYADDGTPVEAVLGINGKIGGLVGENVGGNVLYSYSTGEVSFASDTNKAIIYGGLIANNTVLKLEKFAGKYTSLYQGSNIKDCYSNLKTNLANSLTNSDSRIAGAIGINKDISENYYDNDTTKEVVYNYIIGVYYNKDNLNAPQDNITKNYIGIAEFVNGNTTIPYTEEKMVVYGLSADGMKIANNYDSHTTQDIAFDENGVSLGVQSVTQKWLFGTVWALEEGTNNDMPYLNYQLVYIPDDFNTAGTPVVIMSDRYTFEKGDVDFPIIIVTGENGRLTLMEGQEQSIVVTPAGVELTWTSSDTKTVTVDSNGKVTAIKQGAATVTAKTKSGYTDTITIVVTNLTYSITNYPTEDIEINEGDTYTISGVIVKPSTTLTYSSADTSIATVSAAGVIKGKAEGDTYITISAGSTSVKVKVVVYADVDVNNTVNKRSVTITLEEDYIVDNNFTAVYTGNVVIESAIWKSIDRKASLDFEYKTSDRKVVTVSSSGRYTVTGTGSAYITVKVNDNLYKGTAYMYFDISSPSSTPVETLVFDNSSYSLNIGDSYIITYTGTTQNPSWSSDDTSVASVDSNGRVTAVSQGRAMITGSILRSDGTYATDTCMITVSNNNPVIITLTPNTSRIAVGDSVTITASSTVNTLYTWSYPTTYATIQENGDKVEVTGTQVGTFTITAISTVDPNSSSSATIEVYDAKAYNKYIYNYTQLDAVRYHLDRDYVLMADIDLSGKSWTPIGTAQDPFTGNFYNPFGYTIKNITVAETDYAGLFGYAQGANLNEIKIDNANVFALYAGGLVGIADSTTIYRVYVANSNIKGKNNAGGIVGYAKNNSFVCECNVGGSMVVTAVASSNSGLRFIGGIAGQSENSSIYECTTDITGNISLGSSVHGYAGGIVGWTNSLVTNSSTLRAVVNANDSDNDYAGGIVGYTTNNISIATIRNSTISGYYAGGIGGAINNAAKISLSFKEYKSGYRKSDLNTYSYLANVTEVAVKDSVTVKGNQIGGLFGAISAGVVKDCYTRATLNGTAINAVKGGFASVINSNGFNNVGGTGTAGIVENCYSACKFSGQGKSYSITSSLVHNHAGWGDGSYRNAGYCFNYVFDNDLDGNATHSFGNQIIPSNDKEVKAKKSTTEMQQSNTYIDKNFSSAIWNLTSGYPTLNSEK